MFGTKQLLALTVAVFGISANADNAQADVFVHIDELAYGVQVQSTDLYNEFRLHYSHTPYYRMLMANASRMASLAHHIHDVAHHQGNIYHLDRDLRELDMLFHRVENMVNRLEHDARYFGTGHVHGHTGHVGAKLRRMERDLHHLRADIKRLMPPPRPICPLDGGFGYGVQNGYGHQSGFSGRNGRVRVRIR